MDEIEIVEGAERAERMALKQTVAKILKKIGYETVDASALEMLTHISELIIEQLAMRSKRYTEHGNRIKTNALDIGMALEEMDASWDDVTRVNTILYDIPSLSMKKKTSYESKFSHSQLYKDALNNIKLKLDIAPDHLPPLPGEHSYKFTPETVVRIEDSQEIREKNASETKLVEDNLKKFTMNQFDNTDPFINHKKNSSMDDDLDDEDLEPFVNYEQSKFYHIEQGSSIKSLNRFSN